MELSARNQLAGRVGSIRKAGLMAEVTIHLDGGQSIVAVITSGSVERLGLREGDEVRAVIKATEVLVAK
jgi:molybdopterin-binding protein